MATRNETYRWEKVSKDRIKCVDTETTGLSPEKDEILQVSVVDGNGMEVFSSYVKPVHRKRWPKAQEINGITPAMVKDKPELEDIAADLQAALDCDLLIGYNLSYDLSMLEAGGIEIPQAEKVDIMEWYAEKHGKWNSRHNDYTWVKLGTAAKHYGYEFDAHDALEDVKATVAVFDGLLAEELEFWHQWDAEAPAREEAERRYQAKKEAERLEKEKKARNGRIGCIVAIVILVLLMGGCLATCMG